MIGRRRGRGGEPVLATTLRPQNRKRNIMKANESDGTHSKLTMTQRALQPVLRCLACLLVLATSVASVSIVLAGAAETGGKRGLDTITVNLYVGGPIDKIIAINPTDPDY